MEKNVTILDISKNNNDYHNLPSENNTEVDEEYQDKDYLPTI